MSVSKDVIANIRAKFLAEVQKNPDKYHPKDIEKIKANDWWIERFVLVNKAEDAALAALIKTMEWRKSFGVNDFTDESFPQEIYKIGFMSIHPGKDKEGRTVIWTNMSRYRKSDLTQMMKRYVVYHLEKADRDTSHQGWAVVADAGGAGLSNVDMDFSNYMTEIMQNHYPRGLKYNAIVDLPWILNATLKLVVAFMNEEMKNTVKTLKKDELTQYLSHDYIPVHLKGAFDQPLCCVPSMAKPMEQLCGFTPDQLKKIRSTYKEELKN